MKNYLSQQKETWVVSKLKDKVKKWTQVGLIVASAAVAQWALADDVIKKDDIIKQCDLNWDGQVLWIKERICQRKIELAEEKQKLAQEKQELAQLDGEIKQIIQDIRKNIKEKSE